VLIATGVFSSFSKHKLFKDKFTWVPVYTYLWIINVQKDPNSPVAPTWRNVIDVTSNRARQLRWMCRLCMKQRHSVTHTVQRDKWKLMVRNFCFWRPSFCVWIHTVYIVHKLNLSVRSYKMSGETIWSGVWFSHKKDLKMGCKNQNWKHRPVINVTCL
jgi:hypothetical protein